MGNTIERSERVLRTAIVDVLCSQPGDKVGGRLRRALIDAREQDEHPEDRCDECCDEFEPWMCDPATWLSATGRSWGGPVLCQPCASRRLEVDRG